MCSRNGDHCCYASGKHDFLLDPVQSYLSQTNLYILVLGQIDFGQSKIESNNLQGSNNMIESLKFNLKKFRLKTGDHG